MRLGIDIMGGDNAPSAPLNAAIKYANDYPNDQIIAFGLKEKFQEVNTYPDNFTQIFCTEVIKTIDDPAFVIRNKPDSSMVIGAKHLAKNQLDTFVSAGPSGALVTVAIFIVKRIKGVKRPCLPGVFPTKNGDKQCMFLDLGANILAKPEHLEEYAIFATAYLKAINKIEKPNIKLLNIGEEPEKGIDLYRETYKLLSLNKNINFTGNIEARYIFDSDADAIIMDGFTGNMVLKTIEGTMRMFSNNLKIIYKTNIFTKLSSLVILRPMKKLKRKFDYNDIGGTPIFGIQKVIIKAHGSSNEQAFYNALIQSKTINSSNFIEEIKGELNHE